MTKRPAALDDILLTY